MNTWCISDTHCMENQLVLPEGIDLIIHAGDMTNSKDAVQNEVEFRKSIEWFLNLPIKHKVFIPGNHDRWAMKKYNVDFVKDQGIHLLIHEYLELEGLLFFGSPYTPTFMNWSFMVSRDRITRYWEQIEKCDILITHGPPKGILDLSVSRSGMLEQCGDNALLRAVKRLKPKLHIFGHIHNRDGCINNAIIKPYGEETIFINASCATDNKFSHGIKNGICTKI